MSQKHATPGDFTGLAENYERYRIGYSAELFDTLEKLGVRRGAHILDVACGTGISSLPLVARGMRVTGLDPSPEMLARAKSALPAATFVAGSVEALPFADQSFDAAICAQAFHWFDGDKAFTELLRVVKPGGPIAVWWKVLGSSDAMRALRAAACARAGVPPSPDSLRGGFSAFYRAPFANRTLRVLPFSARFSVEDWLGYEASRASSREAYGANYDAYIAALRDELVTKYGSLAARVEVNYTQYLYVGNSAA